MRTWTLVTDAITPTGHRRASSLAARGKDLVLLGEMRSLLEERAAELRVVHDVDVRTFCVDLTDHDAVSRVARWLEERALVLDGVVSVRDVESDPVRAEQLERQLDALERALAVMLDRRALGRVMQIQGSQFPTRPPPRERGSVIPPRARADTARGHADPGPTCSSTPAP